MPLKQQIKLTPTPDKKPVPAKRPTNEVSDLKATYILLNTVKNLLNNLAHITG